MWRLWAVAEGCAKTLSAIFQKLVGVTMQTLEMGCIAAAIIGCIQACAGFFGRTVVQKETDRKSLIPDRKSALLLMFLGFLEGIFGTVLSIYTFTLGADLAARTLLISFSIVPASIVAAILWPETDRLTLRQIVGIGVFIAAMWAMLDFPDLAKLVRLESWVLLTLVLACANATGEIITRAMAVKFDVWVNNIWIGCSTVLFALTGLALLVTLRGSDGIAPSAVFLAGAIMIGLIVAAMVSFRILAYQGGGTIALRKIIMPGVYLITALFAGVLMYSEPLTAGKGIGIGLWFMSIYLADKKAADELHIIFVRRQTA